MTLAERRRIDTTNDELASNGMRVLGIALAAGLVLFAAIEMEKWILRRRSNPVLAILAAG